MHAWYRPIWGCRTLKLSNEIILAVFLQASGHLMVGAIAQVCRRWRHLISHAVIQNRFGRDILFTKYKKGLSTPLTLSGHKESVYSDFDINLTHHP